MKHLFVELNVGEYWMDSPGFAEHWTERQRESAAKNPRFRRAHDFEAPVRQNSGIQPE